MQLTYYPEIKKEATLPFCVTGVGINDNQLSLPSDTERLFLVTDGCARININGQTIELLKGCACWISPRAHAVIESQVNGVKFNWLTADGISSVSSSLFVSEDHAVFDTADLSASAALFRGIYEALSTDRSYGGFTASAILYQLIIKLNRDAASIPERKCKVTPSIAAVLDYIYDNYKRSITLEMLCVEAGGLSEQYLCRLFKQTTGMRPMEYILKKRISAAREYLEKTDIPISEISMLTGFNNTSYFYRNFKKFTGMSPLVCRQNAFQKNNVDM